MQFQPRPPSAIETDRRKIIHFRAEVEPSASMGSRPLKTISLVLL